MKKASRNLLCVICAFALVLAGAFASPARAAESATLHLRIEGKGVADELLHEDVPFTPGETVEQILASLPEAKNLEIQYTESAYGKYITSIDGEKQSDDASCYWSIYQNGSYAQSGISSLEPADGDSVVLAYCDLDTFYPDVALSAAPEVGKTITFTATAQKTTYDANWTPTVTTVAVSGATIVFNGQTKTTGADGAASFTVASSASYDTYSVSEDTEGQTAPAIVRDLNEKIDGVVENTPVSGITAAPSAGAVSDWSAAKTQAASYLEKSGDSSEWTAFALARAGSAVPSAFLSNAAQVFSQGTSDMNATHLAGYIVAIRAAGADPTSFDGQDLVKLLYEKTNIGQTGINGDIWAQLALDSADYTAPSDAAFSKADLVSDLLKAQNTDGSFSLVSGLAGDVDITAMAVSALSQHVAESGAQAAVNKALAYLSSAEQADGGFVASSSTSEAAESTAQVVIALTSLGIDPTADARFVKNGKNPLSNLLAFSMSDGAFRHDAAGTDNLIATEQALEGLSAYQRLKENKDALYDLRDVSVSVYTAPAVSASPAGTASASGASSETQVTNPDTGAEPADVSAAVFLAAGMAFLLLRRRKA